MKRKVNLIDISSTEVDLERWRPEKNEDVFICLDMNIGPGDGEEGSDLFYVTLATPEGLIKRRRGPCLVKNRTIVISNYDLDLVKGIIVEIIDECARDEWHETCSALQRYFLYEYEDHSYA